MFDLSEEELFLFSQKENESNKINRSVDIQIKEKLKSFMIVLNKFLSFNNFGEYSCKEVKDNIYKIGHSLLYKDCDHMYRIDDVIVWFYGSSRKKILIKEGKYYRMILDINSYMIDNTMIIDEIKFINLEKAQLLNDLFIFMKQQLLMFYDNEIEKSIEKQSYSEILLTDC